MLFKLCRCGSRPRNWVEWQCFQMSTMLLAGALPRQLRFILSDAIVVARDVHQLEREGVT